MISNSPTKSWRCIGWILASAARLLFSSSARIIWRTATIRSPSKNMCSVRQSPMPSAPNLRAWAASAGVSALARMPKVRNSSAHSISSAKSPLSSGCTVGTTPSMISPVLPSKVMNSPAFTTTPRTESVPALPSMRTSPAPATQGLPMPRATTAAWLVMPPVEVRMPSAACMPWMSSGLVSRRTRITFSPARACFSASSAENTALPDAAPGEAGRPLAITLRSPWDRAWDAAADRATTARCAPPPPSCRSGPRAPCRRRS